MYRKCFVKGCGNNSQNCLGKTFFRFPKDGKTFICDNHIPKDFILKKKLKSYIDVENSLRAQNIELPKFERRKIAKKTVFPSKKCSMKHCIQTNLSVPKVKFFQFPKSGTDLYKIWVSKCKLTENSEKLICKYVCERHFDTYR